MLSPMLLLVFASGNTKSHTAIDTIITKALVHLIHTNMDYTHNIDHHALVIWTKIEKVHLKYIETVAAHNIYTGKVEFSC